MDGLWARPAVAGDAEDVAELIAEIRDATAERRGGDRLLETASTSTLTTIVVGIGDALVGLAAFDLEGETATLHFIGVTESCRGVGAGAALLDAVRSSAAELGATGIESVALPGDRDTKNFFETHGLTARRIVVGGPIDG